MNKKAFTLVELIVVITILAILATVGFVSFSWYLAWARDTNRIAQLKSMSDALELYRTKKDLPIPDDKVDVQANWSTIAYQWYIWVNVLETIEYTEKGLDPKDKNYFSYYLTKNKKHFQLLSFLEEPSEDTLAWNSIFNNSQAVDYSERVPHVKWKKLWILTDENNAPIQENSSISWNWYLDVVGTTETYTSHLSDEVRITWSWITLKPLGLSVLNWKEYTSCKEIRDNEPVSADSDDNYYIKPEWYPLFEVYCDMSDDWWGWTRYVEIKWNYTFQDAVDCTDRLERIDNDTLSCFYPYKMWTLTDFKYIDNSWNTDVVNPYKLPIDQRFNEEPWVAYTWIHNTPIFDYMYRTVWSPTEYVRFWLNYTHNHSVCWWSWLHPGWMYQSTTYNTWYMNYNDSRYWTDDCSGPWIDSSLLNPRESNVRPWEFYVR